MFSFRPLSYLTQYNRLLDKSRQGTLTNAEFMMMNKLDLAELHKFEEARELTTSLLVKWLATYKFKDWVTTQTQKKTGHARQMSEKRAKRNRRQA